jgi:putative hemolysin
MTFSTNILLKPFGKKTYTGRAITEEEIRMLIKEGGEQGVFEATEQALIHSVFEFTDMSTKEVMVPATRMVTIGLGMSVEDIKTIITEEQFSRYPVIGKDLNDIRGILYVKDFLNALAKGAVDIRKLIKPPYFIPETMNISNLLKEMQRKRVHMALVIDEYGGVSGLVTMEDLLEEIVGEIRDEYDIESPVVKLSDRTFLVDASISIRDLKEDHDIEIPESTEYETLSGFLLTTLQKIPKVGDVVEIENKKITIAEMVGQRIAKAKLEKLPENISPEE